jgi:hypothetical protein
VWTEVADTAARLALSLTSNDDGKVVVQLDNDTVWLVKDYSGPSYIELTGGSGGGGTVTSVFTRIGDVGATAGDYTAAEITNVASGNLVAVTVQAAIDELDAEKTPLTHTHVVSQVTDAGTVATEDTGTAVGNIPQLEDVGGGTPGLPAVDGSQLTGVAGGGSAITVEDDGNPLTTDVTLLNFAGGGVTVSEPVADEVTITIAPGAAPIDTVFTRTGAVVAEASDYDASQVDNDSTVTGTFVDDALNTLDTDKAETTDARFATTDEKGALAGTGTPSGSNLYVTADTLTAHADSDGSSHSDVTDNATAIGVNAASIEDFRGASAGIGSWAHIGSALEVPDQGQFSTDNSNPNLVTQLLVAYLGELTLGSRALRQAVAGDVLTFRAFDSVAGFAAQFIITSIVDPDDGNPITVNVDDTETIANGSAFSSELYGVDLFAPQGSGGTGSAIIVEDDGNQLTTDVTKLNFAGAVVLTEPVDDEITITVTPGSAPVASVFTRVDAVVAEASDYDASQIDNDATDVNGNVTGAYVSNALDTADVAIESAQSDATDALADAAAAQSDATSAKTKTDFLTVTQTINLDTVESDTATNNAKVTYDDAATVSANAAKLVNVATTITAVGAALVEDTTVIDQRATLGLGSAALLDEGVLIGDLVELENVGGNPGMPAVDGSQLTGVTATSDIEIVDESTSLTTSLVKMTFQGSNVEATEPGAEGEILVTISGAAGAIDVSDGVTTVSGADLLNFDGTAFDVVDQGGQDALVNPIFGTSTGELAEGDHTHDTLANVATGVILGRDTAGTGLSEELTPAEARGVIAVSLPTLLSGTKNDLNNAVADATIISNDEPTQTPEEFDFARFVDNETIEGRSYAETQSDLNLVIGTDVQAWSADLDSVSGSNTGDEAAATTTTAGIVELATDGEVAADVVVQGNDSRLDDARAPTSHAYDSHSGTVPIADIAGTPTGTGNIVLETSPTIVTPTIASMTNAGHDHSDAAGGGALGADTVTYSIMQNVVADDVILGNIGGAGSIVDELTGTEVTALLDNFETDSTLSGTVPGSNSAGASAYLDGTGAWSTPAGGGDVSFGTGTVVDNQMARFHQATGTIIQGGDTQPTIDDSGNIGLTAANTVDGVDVSELSDIANMAQDTFAGRITASTGAPEELSSADATSMLDLATTSLPGLGPARTGGASTDYLSADGTYTVPPGGSAATLTKSITVEDPAADENISMFYTTVAITVTQITAVIVGSTSVDINVSHGTSRAAVTNDVLTADEEITSTSTGDIFTSGSFDDEDIPPDSFVALTTSALSGTPDELHVTIEYTED